MNYKHGFIALLILALIALLILGGVYVYMQNKQTSQLETVNTATSTSATTKPPTSYENKLAGCESFANNSTNQVSETTRRFFRLPKDIYPYVKENVQVKTVSGSATMSYVSNGGLPGQGLLDDLTAKCWATYYEFIGSGEVDLSVKSTVAGIQDYFVRFLVSSIDQTTSTAQTSNSQTMNWKTYTNTKYGFSFQYPQDWQIVVLPSDSYPSPQSDKKVLYIKPQSTGQTSRQYIDSESADSAKNGPLIIIASSKNISIGGLSAIQLSGTSGGAGFDIWSSVVKKDNTIFDLSISSRDRSYTTTDIAEYDHIISTFKFSN